MHKIGCWIAAIALLMSTPTIAQVATLPMVSNAAGQTVGTNGVVLVDSQGDDATDTANNAVRINCVVGCPATVSASGSLAALNANTTLTLGGASGFAADIRGTFTGTVTFQGTIDGTNWITLAVMPAGSGTNISTVTTAAAAGAWVGNASGMQQVRTIMTAYTSGTATVTLRAVQGTAVVLNLPAGATTQAVLLSAGTAAVGDVGLQYRNTATGAATSFSILSPATPAGALIKSGAGRLIGCFLTNTAAAVRSVKFYNATAVTMGTTSAVFEIDLPQNGYGYFDLPGGIGFATGQMWAVTSAKGLTDNTATGLVANDVSGVCWSI